MPHRHFTFSSLSFPKYASRPLSPVISKEVASPSDTILLSSHCACWAVIQPCALTVLPAWDGMLWHVAVVCPLQPRAKLCRPLERSSGAVLLGVIELLGCL